MHAIQPLIALFCNYFAVCAVERCTRVGDVSIQASSSNNTFSTAGRVQYCIQPNNGGGSLFWAVVCNSTFRLNEAHVACRSNSLTHAAYTALPGAM